MKYVPYFTDGYGRDRYIAYDNGGFFSKNNNGIIRGNGRRTGTSFDTKLAYKYKSPSVKTPNFHYHSDGNGRDMYIMINGGGLYYDSKPLNSFRLTDFLRANNPYEVKSSVRNGKIYVSKSEYKYNQLLRNKEKDIINRLYEKEKRKFIKPKLIEIAEENNKGTNLFGTLPSLGEVQINTIPSILPKGMININSHFQDKSTLNNIQKHKITSNNKNLPKRSFLNQFSYISNTDENLVNELKKINKYDVSQKLKKENKSFTQPYLHFRNNNS